MPPRAPTSSRSHSAECRCSDRRKAIRRAARAARPEPLELAERVGTLFSGSGALAGRRVLITAGPTRERIDPVRFISNRSSGKMGFAVAQAAREAGAEVILVSGPVSLPTPPGVRRVDVESAADMLATVLREVEGIDIF